MTNDENSRPAARSGAASHDADGAKSERDAAARATLDNMARLRALRLAREAAEPQRAAPSKAKRAQSSAGKTTGSRTSAGKKAETHARALSDWLAEQQKGGHRT
ncbi:hypothetical protein LPW26_21550 [Rhodopseudomonas sp. HC1]|uniref:hypothetical protein n=1 Tax=Rhodopseudomonas infernalis TaxID=2897386 RepID=UPI001EE7AAE0|nr:hypothetical protein [Rhodopseudomonas infernalis]MCG6207240.1 hypothetical protein [Rhodopseudomonas infernalis]